MVLRRPSTELLAALGMYMLLGALVVIAFSAARAAGDWSLNFESNAVRLLTAAAVAGVLCAVALLVVGYRYSRENTKAGFWLPVTMSVLVVVFFLGVTEGALRVLDRPDPLGRRIGSVTLLPYEWPAAAEANLALAKEHRNEDSFIVEDGDLGWTIGRSRSSSDGLYHSSAEGLRSDVRARSYLSVDAPRPIALMGDSFAFSEEVPYENSLAFHLERQLPGRQILNFGVPGYGIDQSLLRFEKEVKSWRPQKAIFAFIDDDLFRTENTYVFLKAWGIPLSKPRFALSNGRLELLNSPTLTPEEMFSKESVFDLPWIEQDLEFVAHRWRTHPLHASYLLRFLVSRVPVWPASARTTEADSIVVLSSGVIERFVEAASAAGIDPVVVYLPTTGDLRGGNRAVKQRVVESLGAGGIQVHDLTECVASEPDDDALFMSGGHYSDLGNTVVARCLAPALVTL